MKRILAIGLVGTIANCNEQIVPTQIQVKPASWARASPCNAQQHPTPIKVDLDRDNNGRGNGNRGGLGLGLDRDDREHGRGLGLGLDRDDREHGRGLGLGLDRESNSGFSHGNGRGRRYSEDQSSGSQEGFDFTHGVEKGHGRWQGNWRHNDDISSGSQDYERSSQDNSLRSQGGKEKRGNLRWRDDESSSGERRCKGGRCSCGNCAECRGEIRGKCSCGSCPQCLGSA